MTKPTIQERIEATKDDLIECAGLYATSGDPEDWRTLCTLKATLEALRRCLKSN